MTKWEYAVVASDVSKDLRGERVVVGWFVRKQGSETRIAKTEHNSLLSVLDGLGAEGWEAVSHTSFGASTVLLKRQVVPE